MNEISDILETRRDFYNLLYRMYIEKPPRELAGDLVNERFHFKDLTALDVNADLIEGFQLLNEFTEKSKGADVDKLHESLMDEYTRLFLGPFRLPVEPYEAWWVSGHRLGKALVKVKSDYRKAGIVKSRDYTEPEDFIGFELKFMHYLCEEELSADSNERQKECLILQREFMDDHILQWVPNFCDAVYECELADFYKGIARVTKGFIIFDDVVIKELLENV
jgi:TorA maturation chaperone TorD